MKISVYGNTHYAWVTAAKLAEKGNVVSLCVNPREGLPDAFDAGRERLLPELIETQKAAGRLSILMSCRGAGDLHLLADDYTEDSLRRAIQPVLASMTDDVIILVLTPLPVGTLRRIQHDIDLILSEDKRTERALLASMPLFIREGSALADFERPQLFLLGSENKTVIDCVQEVMRPFMRQAAEVMVVPVEAAELIKFGINAMLATRISFMNEMAALSEKVGVDVELVRQGMGADSRIGRDYLQPGCGFGGPSFSADLLSFARTIREELDTAGLIDAVLDINNSQREILFRKIWRFFRGELQGRTVAIWGAAFKPGTSSVSNSVVHPLLQALWAQGCCTRVYDPQAMEALRRVYRQQPLLVFTDSAASAAEGADAIALVTAWDEFWSPDFDGVVATMKQPAMFDGRNLYEPEQMQAYGFRYFGIGRGEVI
ncbi:MAG: nucleotide sugar dehydrogenase [Moraxellaceae bacterium]|nr:nucleotide sugar dehydrogenase [Moraxellaceae bacterium]